MRSRSVSTSPSQRSSWTLDWYAQYVTPCVDCAALTATSTSAKVSRGGGFTVPANVLRAAARDLNGPPGQRSPVVGFRCARSR